MKKLVYLFAAVLGLAACGQRGPQGPPGPRGLDAVTNVQAFEYTITPSAWGESGSFGQADYGFVALAEVPEITNDILNDGSVMAYKIEGQGEAPLPVIYYEQGYHINFDYLAFLGEIEFWKRASDNQTEAPQDDLIYKVVVMENFYKSGGKKEQLQNLSLKDLEEQLQIKEYKKITVR